jgi:hypothetical protein
MKAWKVMVKNMNFSTILLVNFIINVNIWWASNYAGGTFGVSILWAQELHRNGLKCTVAMWD